MITLFHKRLKIVALRDFLYFSYYTIPNIQYCMFLLPFSCRSLSRYVSTSNLLSPYYFCFSFLCEIIAKKKRKEVRAANNVTELYPAKQMNQNEFLNNLS